MFEILVSDNMNIQNNNINNNNNNNNYYTYHFCCHKLSLFIIIYYLLNGRSRSSHLTEFWHREEAPATRLLHQRAQRVGTHPQPEPDEDPASKPVCL